MKKVIMLFTLILIFPGVVMATDSDDINSTIENFEESVNYPHDRVVSGTTTGLITKKEYELTLNNDYSYLLSPLSYWAKNDKNEKIIISNGDVKDGEGKTAYVRPTVYSNYAGYTDDDGEPVDLVSGKGSYNSPWVLPVKKYKVTISSTYIPLLNEHNIINTTDYYYGDKLDVPSLNNTNEGYVFEGWYTEKKCGGNKLDEDGKISTNITSDLEIYACEKEIATENNIYFLFEYDYDESNDDRNNDEVAGSYFTTKPIKDHKETSDDDINEYADSKIYEEGYGDIKYNTIYMFYDIDWNITFSGSGKLHIYKLSSNTDIFLVGGGAGGKNGYDNGACIYSSGGSGGAGGSITTDASIDFYAENEGKFYEFTIGSGGDSNNNGNDTKIVQQGGDGSFTAITAKGGISGKGGRGGYMLYNAKNWYGTNGAGVGKAGKIPFNDSESFNELGASGGGGGAPGVVGASCGSSNDSGCGSGGSGGSKDKNGKDASRYGAGGGGGGADQPSVDGYCYKNSGKGGKGFQGVIIMRNTEYYTIKLDNDGGDGKTEQVVVNGFSLPTINVPTKSGYSFVGYYDADEVQYYDKNGKSLISYYNINGDIDLKAKWQSNTYNVILAANYTSNNGKWKKTSYKINNKTTVQSLQNKIENNTVPLKDFPKPSKTGYEFKGWSCSIDGSILSDESNWEFSTCNSNVLYPIWEASQYNVTIESCGIYDKYIDFDSKFDTCIPKKDGYKFKGWHITGMNNVNHYYYNDKDAETKFTGTESDVSVSTEIKFKNLRSTSGSVTIEANWEEIKYSITYTLNGGKSGGNQPSSATYDKEFTVSNPTRTGYTFTGWTITDSSGETIMSNTTSTTFENLTIENKATVTFTANWEPIKYHIDYVLGDGGSQDGSCSPSEATYGNIFKVCVPTTTKENCTFNGWKITGMTNNTHYSYKDDETELGTNSSATWEPSKLSVKFKNLTTKNDTTVTFTAKWTCK